MLDAAQSVSPLPGPGGALWLSRRFGNRWRGVPPIWRLVNLDSPMTTSCTSTLRIVQIFAALAVAFANGEPAIAQSTAQQSGAWQYEVTPYLWVSGMKGDVRSGNLPKTSVDMSFGDIVDVLDFGLMGALEARKGRWGLLFDAVYMKVSDSATASRAGPGGVTLTANADVKMKQSMLAGAVAYRAVEGRSPMDVIGGVRYSKIDVNANINANLFGLTGFVVRSGDKDWVDPYIGVRVQHPLTERWIFVGYADVGGFGVGSDFTWQTALGVNYEFSKTMTAKLGYRYLSVDYDRGGFAYDMKTRGVYLGVGMRF
jgi:opacity protein-like surface antigen